MNIDNTTKVKQSPPKVDIIEANINLTSQAGLIPVTQFLEKFNFMALIKEVLNFKRPDYAVYGFADVVFLAVIAIVGGATSVLMISFVWADKILRLLAGFTRVPEASNLNRIFHHFTFEMVNALEEVNHRMRERIWNKAFQGGKSFPWTSNNMFVDADSTVKTVYGTQEGAEKGYNPKKRGALSYHPLIAFCAHTKEILQAWFRSGSAYTSNGTVDFLKQLFVHITKGIRVIFRADSGFFDGAILDLLEENKFGFLIKVKMRNLNDLLSQQQWKGIPDHEGWESCEFYHQCHGWKISRRFVAVRKEKKEDKVENGVVQLKLYEEKAYEYFCYVDSEGLSAWETHKKYGERATSETWIDEAKNQMSLAHIKTDDFWTNSALFQCAVMAYNTICWMRLCSGDDSIKKWEVKTIRTFLIRVAGKLVKNARKLSLKLGEIKIFPVQWRSWLALGCP